MVGSSCFLVGRSHRGSPTVEQDRAASSDVHLGDVVLDLGMMAQARRVGPSVSFYLDGRAISGDTDRELSAKSAIVSKEHSHVNSRVDSSSG